MISLFTYDEAAEKWRVPRALLEEGVCSGGLPSINRGNIVLLREENIDAYLISKETSNPPQRNYERKRN